jgi:hypothetical protein
MYGLLLTNACVGRARHLAEEEEEEEAFSGRVHSNQGASVS